MKILFKHSGILPVKRYGGTERILYWLMKELVKMGHDVTLIGHPKSEVESDKIKLIPYQDSIDWRMLIPKDTDLIHLFYCPDKEIDYPLMVTIEGNGRPGEDFHKNTVFVSAKHASLHDSAEFVYNGLDLSEYPVVKKENRGWKDFLFLAKASWKVKNLTHCISACKINKKNLHIAGGRKFSMSTKIKSYGMVDQVKKRELLTHVDALLWPVRWHEPFGIAIIEAYSAGIPVIGSPYGSLKELITPDVGLICQNYKEFKEAVSGEKKFDPEHIRNVLETKYSAKVMTEKYLQYYNKILSGENLNPRKPKYLEKRHPEDLLSF